MSRQKQKAKNWSNEETKQLVAIWAEPEIKAQVNKMTSNKKDVWKEISVRLHDHGNVARTSEQVYNKVKDLKKNTKS